MEIGISTYNDYVMTDNLITSIIYGTNSIYGKDYTITVVDDGTPDKNVISNLENVCKHHGVRLLINSENRGTPYTFNKIVQNAEGELITIFCNDTLVIDPNWLKGINYFMSENDRIGITGFPLINILEKDRKEETSMRHVSCMPRITGADRMIGGVFSFKKDVWKQIKNPDGSVGFWEDDLKGFLFETHFAFKILELGYDNFMMGWPLMVHLGSATYRRNPELFLQSVDFSKHNRNEYLSTIKNSKLYPEELKTDEKIILDSNRVNKLAFDRYVFSKYWNIPYDTIYQDPEKFIIHTKLYNKIKCSKRIIKWLDKNLQKNCDIISYKNGNIRNEINIIQNEIDKIPYDRAFPYDRAYFDGDSKQGYHPPGYQNFPSNYTVVNEILKLSPKSVLELGGCRGYISHILENQGIDSTCLDISPHCWHTRSCKKFVLADATDIPLPFGDKQFDLCHSKDLLEHIGEEKIDGLIKEILRVSRKSFHLITFSDHPYAKDDKTHKTLKSREWWVDKFNQIAGNDYHYQCIIEDKEKYERVPISIPQSSDNLTKLNIGPFINMSHYGWINIDKINLSDFASQNGYIFRQEDVSTRGIPYPDNSVDVIIASHFLEHLDRKEGKKFLSECLRVLKNSGIIRLTVPDTELITKKYVEKCIDEYRHVNIGVENSEYNSQSLYELLLAGHKTIYDYESLSKLLSNVGFDNIQRMSFGKSNSKEIEAQTIDMYPTLSLYVEATPKEQITIGDVSSLSPLSTGPTITYGNLGANILPAKDKLRIAIISTPFFQVPPLKYGGLEQVVWDLACGLDELGHEVTIFGPEGSMVPKHGHLVVTGYSVLAVNIDWFEEERKRYEVYRQYITPDKFDLVHDHTWFGFPYLLKRKYPQLKVLHTHHGSFVWESPPNW